MKALFDSDILIDYLQGATQAKKEIERYSTKCISVISWIEVMVGLNNEDEEPVCRGFLNRFAILDITSGIAEKALAIRRKHKIKLPDAIIWGTAQEEDCLLVTRNTKDFPKNDPGVHIPYQLH